MDAFFQFTKLSTFQCIPISLFLLFLCIYQSFLSTYKDIIGKLSIHHIMFFAYGSSQRKWKPFFCWLLLFFHSQAKKKLWSCPSVSKVCIEKKNYVCIVMEWVPDTWVSSTCSFVESQSKKAFLNILTNFSHIWWFFKVEHTNGAAEHW